MCHAATVARGLLIGVVLALAGCGRSDGGPASTHTSSGAFATLDEKVAFLERYVTFRRRYLELEYGIFYQNNGGGLVPGPSEWDLTILARVPASELDAWTQGMKRVAGRPPELTNLGCEQVDLSGLDEWYEELGKYVGLDREHAIVAYRATAR